MAYIVKGKVVLNAMTSPNKTLLKSEIVSLKVNCYLKSAEIVMILTKTLSSS